VNWFEVLESRLSGGFTLLLNLQQAQGIMSQTSSGRFGKVLFLAPGIRGNLL
jgi:hypothetical protein